MFGKRMHFKSLAVAGLLLVGLSSFPLAHGQDTAKRGRKYKAPAPVSKVEVTVLRATTGKPIENASVIFHPLVDGKDSGNMELKTNDEGKATLDLLELGTSVRVQVIAPGFQTYGEDYKLDKESLAFEVKLKRPQAQYSIYKQGEGKEGDKSTARPDAKPDAKPDAQPQSDQKDASPDAKPAPDAGQPDSKPQSSTPPSR
jgi:hypothetical protein